MSHKNNIKGNAWVVVGDNGYMQLYTADGHLVAPNLWIRLQDDVCEPSTAIAKFVVNIAKDKADMMAQILEMNAGVADLSDERNKIDNSTSEVEFLLD